MNNRQLVILAVLAAVSVAATSIVLRTSTPTVASDRRGERVLPAVADKANEVTGLIVHQGADTLAMERRDAGFVAAESGFPVKTDAVRNLLASSIELTFEEARTSDPARYHELGIADPGTSEGSGTEVVLRTAAGELADFVVGNRDLTVGGAVGGVFIRIKGQPQTWLARGNVRLPANKAEWISPVDFDIKRSDIKKIELSGGGIEGVTVTANSEKPGEFTLEKVPEKRVADTFKLSRLATMLESPAIKDVRKPSKPADNPRRVIFDVADGLRLVLTAVGEPAEGWVQISAEATGDAQREKAAAISAKVKGFEFQLQPHQGEILGWTANDLTNEQQG